MLSVLILVMFIIIMWKVSVCCWILLNSVLWWSVVSCLELFRLFRCGWFG